MNVYEKITGLIIEQLEQGTVPWNKPWRVSVPRNFVSKKAYRGINLLLLGIQNFDCEYWVTFRQANKLGGSVKKGSKGTTVVYTDWFKIEDKETGEIVERPFLKQYKAFNLEQTEGIEIPAPEQPKLDKLTRCENIWKPMPSKPDLKNDGGNRAFYRSATDSIHLPMWSRFKTAEEYYSTLFHELVHSTGHKTRLMRPGIEEFSGFGSENYSKEELVAEIGAAFLCGLTGIETKTIDNSAAYVKGWLKALADDKKLVVIAAAQAQKAVDYISSEHR